MAPAGKNGRLPRSWGGGRGSRGVADGGGAGIWGTVLQLG